MIDNLHGFFANFLNECLDGKSYFIDCGEKNVTDNRIHQTNLKQLRGSDFYFEKVILERGLMSIRYSKSSIKFPFGNFMLDFTTK
jgi:hypothetical protein